MLLTQLRDVRQEVCTHLERVETQRAGSEETPGTSRPDWTDWSSAGERRRFTVITRSSRAGLKPASAHSPHVWPDRSCSRPRRREGCCWHFHPVRNQSGGRKCGVRSEEKHRKSRQQTLAHSHSPPAEDRRIAEAYSSLLCYAETRINTATHRETHSYDLISVITRSSILGNIFLYFITLF